MTTALETNSSATATSQLYRVHGVADLGALAADRALGHRLVMSWLPDGCLDSRQPRQAAGALWRVDAAADHFWLRSAAPVTAATGSQISFEEVAGLEAVAGDEVTVSVELERTHSPLAHVPDELWQQRVADKEGVKPFRGRRVAVPAEQMGPWLQAKFEVAGCRLEQVLDQQMGAAVIGARGKRRVPTVAVQARVQVTDAQVFDKAVTTGLGRGKSYGMGLMLLQM